MLDYCKIVSFSDERLCYRIRNPTRVLSRWLSSCRSLSPKIRANKVFTSGMIDNAKLFKGADIVLSPNIVSERELTRSLSLCFKKHILCYLQIALKTLCRSILVVKKVN